MSIKPLHSTEEVNSILSVVFTALKIAFRDYFLFLMFLRVLLIVVFVPEDSVLCAD